ncbi:MAG: InlB B-repeat-containing protein, partial [Kiritimatiellae bacterium]|nr:InlB B-repeat-containing protein [Kiritimatiellia bacterium]
GGGGGSGATYYTAQGQSDDKPNGGSGGGGTGGYDGKGTRSDGVYKRSVTGGNGASGGSMGETPGAGSLYVSSAASVSGASATGNATTHSAIEYTITFSDQYRLTTNVTARYSFAYPDAPSVSRLNYTFGGWYTDRDGKGTQYYDAENRPTQNMWKQMSNQTLYAKWTLNPGVDFDDVTLVVNGTPIIDGVSTNGVGWSYSGETGFLRLTGQNRVYDIHGTDLDGMAAIVAEVNCTIQVSSNLTMNAQSRSGRTPVTVSAGRAVTFDVKEGVTCSLTASPQRTAIRVPNTASLTLKTAGVLQVTGGSGAADLGCGADDTDAGTIYVETRENWAANIRPGHGMEENNGLLNTKGKGASYLSLSPRTKVWSVRLDALPDMGNPVRLYRQRSSDTANDEVLFDANLQTWIWAPADTYEWSDVANADSSQNNVWVADVKNSHTRAELFTSMNITVNGEDIAHLTGNGWRCERDTGNKATLSLTAAGPYVISGRGNVGISVYSDASVTLSDLSLTVANWGGKTALYLQPGKNLNLTLNGTNSLASASECAGIFVGETSSLTIGGNGTLKVNGGAYAAGIGGSVDNPKSGVITINGGNITAHGGTSAAGIGGGCGVVSVLSSANVCRAITITGGIVKAIGGKNGAGIGGGLYGTASVTISGGTVFPTAGFNASAIGKGYSGYFPTIPSSTLKAFFGYAAIYTTRDAVSPAPVNTSNKSVYPVTFDIGTSNCRIVKLVLGGVNCPCKDLWTDETGKFTIWLPPTSRTTAMITLEDGSVYSAGYSISDNGTVEFSHDVLTVDATPVVGGVSSSGSGWAYSAATSNLVFRSGNHSVSGGSTNGTIRIVAAGDGVGLTLSRLMLKTPLSYLSPFVVSNRCTVTLAGVNLIECICDPTQTLNSRKGSRYTAAVEVPEGATLTIGGTGTLIANGGIYGAGIGSRGENLKAGSVIINSGSVYATGGEYAAGIGGGDGGSVTSILVTGGYVDATGGRGACGIGGGNGNGVTLADGTFRVTGGTVLAEKGNGLVFSDFVTGSGNTVSPTMGKSIVIEGGSVRPKNATAANANPYPAPVDADGEQLVFAVFKGLTAGDTVTVTDGLWPQYDNVVLRADDDGAVCLWGAYTNAARAVMFESVNLAGGQAVLEVGAWSNTVYSVTESGAELPESKTVKTAAGNVTCWRVIVPALPAGQRVTVRGLDEAFVSGSTVSDFAGNASVYLPDGEYDFEAAGFSYHAVVSGAVATATFTVGLTVDGTDISAGSGDGWVYDALLGTLTLASAREYRLAGTNDERTVS